MKNRIFLNDIILFETLDYNIKEIKGWFIYFII